MSQNLVSLVVSDEQVSAALAAVQQFESALPDLLTLEDGLRGLSVLGPRSETFARQTLRVLAQNPAIVPPSLNLAEAQADLASRDRLLPVLERMKQLVSRLEDTVDALGSDVMDTALDGYAQLKLSGSAHGLDDLRRELSGRFAKARRRAAEPG